MIPNDTTISNLYVLKRKFATAHKEPKDFMRYLDGMIHAMERAFEDDSRKSGFGSERRSPKDIVSEWMAAYEQDPERLTPALRRGAWYIFSHDLLFYRSRTSWGFFKENQPKLAANITKDVNHYAAAHTAKLVLPRRQEVAIKIRLDFLRTWYKHERSEWAFDGGGPVVDAKLLLEAIDLFEDGVALYGGANEPIYFAAPDCDGLLYPLFKQYSV